MSSHMQQNSTDNTGQKKTGCTLKISIGQAMLLVFILKLFVTIVLFSVFFTVALLLRNTWKFYIIGLGIMAVSWILFSQIDANSFLAILTGQPLRSLSLSL